MVLLPANPASPGTFALCDPATGRQGVVLAVGMTLPDGGAVTVDWRTGRAGAVGVWTSPQAAAAVHQAELVWYARAAPPAAPSGPPNGGLWRKAG
jgi:hypothetical protein